MMRRLKYPVLSGFVFVLLMCVSLVFKEKIPRRSFTNKHKAPALVPKPAIKFEPLPSQTPHDLPKQTLVEAKFDEFISWDKVDALGSFKAFQQSCKLWVNQNPNQSIGNNKLPMKVKDWLPICQQALSVPADISEAKAKEFFASYFRPFHWKSYHKGKFTGYYAPAVVGSEVKTKEYNTPLYDVPAKGLGLHLSRSEIYRGALRGKAKIIAWLKSPVDAMLLEIEGSGVIETPNGKQIYVDYAAQNGRRYRSLAQLLIHDHIFKPAKASILAIKAYFVRHPGRLQAYIRRNPSFVFFKRCTEDGFKGSQNVLLTPKYSLAVDRRFIPLGVPLLIKTQYPVNTKGKTQAMQRIMIAQDTGGAIRGPIRGDIFWGTGQQAMLTANLMSHEGDYWFLLPKHFRIS